MSKMWAAGVAICLIAAPAAVGALSESETMMVVKDADLVWKDFPGFPGVRVAVVYGDPAKEGLYAIRVRFAPGVMSQPHYHPEARYVTVLKGTWWAGEGDRFDPKSTVPVPAGSFAMHHPKKVHFDGAKDEEVIVQIVGIGPSGTIAVKPGEMPK